MRFYTFAVILALVTSCRENSVETDDQSSSKSMLVYEISNQVFKQLKEEKNLIPCECGGGSREQLKLLHWGFDYYKEINIEEARELLVAATNQFLIALNADQRIRPYLAVYPFQPENIEIRIFIYNPDGSLMGLDKLRVIAIKRGVLDYMIESSETQQLETILLESYKEAESKLATPLQQAI